MKRVVVEFESADDMSSLVVRCEGAEHRLQSAAAFSPYEVPTPSIARLQNFGAHIAGLLFDEGARIAQLAQARGEDGRIDPDKLTLPVNYLVALEALRIVARLERQLDDLLPSERGWVERVFEKAPESTYSVGVSHETPAGRTLHATFEGSIPHVLASVRQWKNDRRAGRNFGRVDDLAPLREDVVVAGKPGVLGRIRKMIHLDRRNLKTRLTQRTHDFFKALFRRHGTPQPGGKSADRSDGETGNDIVKHGRDAAKSPRTRQ